MRHAQSTLIRGALAGLVGGGALAGWFYVIDVLRGTPLHTSLFLARTLTGAGEGLMPGAVGMLLLTLVHLAAFMAAGAAVAWLLGRAGIATHVLLGPVFGFLLFDAVFYTGVGVTGLHVVRDLGWPDVLAGNLLAGTATFAWLHRTTPGGMPGWLGGRTRSRLLRDGALAGLAGATAVALWFLLVDAARGQPLYTPAALGSALLGGARSVAEVEQTAAMVARFSLLHLAAFLGLGMLAAIVVGGAQRDRPLLPGAVLLFVALEAFAIGMVAVAAGWLLTVLPWWTIAVANMLAVLAMGLFLWRDHPQVRWALEQPGPGEQGLEGAGG
jgi:hypothetical protein